MITANTTMVQDVDFTIAGITPVISVQNPHLTRELEKATLPIINNFRLKLPPYLSSLLCVTALDLVTQEPTVVSETTNPVTGTFSCYFEFMKQGESKEIACLSKESEGESQRYIGKKKI